MRRRTTTKKSGLSSSNASLANSYGVDEAHIAIAKNINCPLCGGRVHGDPVCGYLWCSRLDCGWGIKELVAI